MSLGNEIHEWRKQIVEKLLLNGVKPEDLEKQVSAAQKLIYGSYIDTVVIECPLKFKDELKATLLEFSQKNGCHVISKVNR
ncbi:MULTISPECIES: hypothetical protein [unclassified Acinetobacter]|uniref:hypothetical protein n=1 Tax=unclassified Acinetobacter TaxID=196816 RepID=UPI001BC87E47|nr:MULTISPECIES: hypothetical protein [unclassified Acinetobacter]